MMKKSLLAGGLFVAAFILSSSIIFAGGCVSGCDSSSGDTGGGTTNTSSPSVDPEKLAIAFSCAADRCVDPVTRTVVYRDASGNNSHIVEQFQEVATTPAKVWVFNGRMKNEDIMKTLAPLYQVSGGGYAPLSERHIVDRKSTRLNSSH